ncbi:MAG: alpha,alpha-trehalose-phosphate synthase (UDP-forming) [Shimia sp.]
MSGRLIVVSNRLHLGDAPPQGGLVVALHEALQARGGHWVGADPELTHDTAPEGLRSFDGDGYRRHTFQLSEQEHSDFYLGFANSVLWPLCHRRVDLVDIQPGHVEGYVAVNAKVAKAVASIAKPSDTIWVQDYHFLPLAQALRDEGVTARIGFFLHIPFPVATDLQVLPEGQALPGWLAAYDLVGLQTQADVARCLEVMRQSNKAELMPKGRVHVRGRSVAIRSFPIGIDAQGFAEAAVAGDGRQLFRTLTDDRDYVIGVDRLDYSKGLPQRFLGFEAYLRRTSSENPATLLQIAPPSRQDVAAYQEIREELEGIAGRVNGAWSELNWTPIRYIHRAYPRETLAPLYRAARAGLVTSLADGMNLVAKEYVAAQDPEDPGVLVLSSLAGAAEQLTTALLVNPYDAEDIGAALDTALAMPRAERLERFATLRESVFTETVTHWAEAYLRVLAGLAGPTENAA